MPKWKPPKERIRPKKKKKKIKKIKYEGTEEREHRETIERKFALIDRIKSLRTAKLSFVATGDRVSRWPRAFSTTKKLDTKKVKGEKQLQLIGAIKVGDKTIYYYVNRREKQETKRKSQKE